MYASNKLIEWANNVSDAAGIRTQDLFWTRVSSHIQ